MSDIKNDVTNGLKASGVDLDKITLIEDNGTIEIRNKVYPFSMIVKLNEYDLEDRGLFKNQCKDIVGRY